MRRDYFTLDVRGLDWIESDGEPQQPTVTIGFEGPASALRSRLETADGDVLDAAETDVTFRLQDDLEAEGSTGVVSVTNRITGEFILELNEETTDVLRFVKAARTYGKETDESDGHYRVIINIEGEDVISYRKSTFLVYDSEGNLLRQHSLIPSGVEL